MTERLNGQTLSFLSSMLDPLTPTSPTFPPHHAAEAGRRRGEQYRRVGVADIGDTRNLAEPRKQTTLNDAGLQERALRLAASRRPHLLTARRHHRKTHWPLDDKRHSRTGTSGRYSRKPPNDRFGGARGAAGDP